MLVRLRYDWIESLHHQFLVVTGAFVFPDCSTSRQHHKQVIALVSTSALPLLDQELKSRTQIK